MNLDISRTAGLSPQSAPRSAVCPVGLLSNQRLAADLKRGSIMSIAARPFQALQPSWSGASSLTQVAAPEILFHGPSLVARQEEAAAQHPPFSQLSPPNGPPIAHLHSTVLYSTYSAGHPSDSLACNATRAMQTHPQHHHHHHQDTTAATAEGSGTVSRSLLQNPDPHLRLSGPDPEPVKPRCRAPPIRRPSPTNQPRSPIT